MANHLHRNPHVRAASLSSAAQARVWASLRSCSRRCTRSRQRRAIALSAVLLILAPPLTRCAETATSRAVVAQLAVALSTLGARPVPPIGLFLILGPAERARAL